MFDIRNGAPAGAIKVADALWLNDIAVAGDGTSYASQTGTPDGKAPMRIYKITPDDQATVFLEGAPLSLPNGVAIGNDGSIVMVRVVELAGGCLKTNANCWQVRRDLWQYAPTQRSWVIERWGRPTPPTSTESKPDCTKCLRRKPVDCKPATAGCG